MLYGAIEAGGTKIICAIGNENGEILETVRFDTLTPDVTMPKIIEYFKKHEISSLGIGCFGPVGVNPAASNYGFILDTPKLAWAQFDFLGTLKKEFSVPMAFDTDVNGAALAEYKWGAARGVNSCLYITVGTGVGAGALIDGQLIHGLLHPEMGHILVRNHVEDTFEGVCPYHGCCLEGMAAGPAVEKRWGVKGHLLEEDHKAWEFEAYYMAQGILSYIMVLSPEKIVLGGGVMGQDHLVQKIRAKVKELVNGYIKVEALGVGIEDYIVRPGLGEISGTYGALALAISAK
ncbi:MAG: ROK family protein [Vallitaleaceae bacterium]|nr:ROK family protein [Vallitaleaceae bacterium]